MKQIPNFFTLLNLVFGCLAIVCVLQVGENIIAFDDASATGTVVNFPEKIWWGALFLFAAAVVDFLDGFLARLLKAQSGMGEQLDSLSDMVSFGVAPGMILYQLLRMGYAQQEGGLDIGWAALLPAFIFTGAVAWRLAKFNISTTQKYSFEGVPSPAGGLLVASLPLAIFYDEGTIRQFLINPWVLYGIILVVSYLMVSRHTFMALKFRDFSLRNNLLKYILLAAGLVLAVAFGWLAVPLIFVLYVVLSFFSKEPQNIIVGEHAEREEKDITV
ncbi:MAG: CDP-alcohol phosphatidyltransferase [Sphingobacteriales bacterium]|nr:MAG: CDP-alcohol phosphatidyltransferase [Sphingobacteriales bacterium]